MVCLHQQGCSSKLGLLSVLAVSWLCRLLAAALFNANTHSLHLSIPSYVFPTGAVRELGQLQRLAGGSAAVLALKDAAEGHACDLLFQ
jgi:hypothetical protein